MAQQIMSIYVRERAKEAATLAGFGSILEDGDWLIEQNKGKYVGKLLRKRERAALKLAGGRKINWAAG